MAGAQKEGSKRTVLGLRPRSWLIAGIILVLVLAVVGVLWLVATSKGVADRTWRKWDGWTAVGAFGGILAGMATLGTLIFFYLQLRGIRQQARKDFELAHTPLIS